MSLAERCDQIVRLIDDALSEVGLTAVGSTAAGDTRDGEADRHRWRVGTRAARVEGRDVAA